MAVFRTSKAKFPTPPPAFAFHPAVSPSVAQLKTTAVTTNRSTGPKKQTADFLKSRLLLHWTLERWIVWDFDGRDLGLLKCQVRVTGRNEVGFTQSSFHIWHPGFSLCPMALFRVFPLPTKWPNIPAHDVVSSVDYFLTISPFTMAEDPKNVLKATTLRRRRQGKFKRT